MIPIQCLVIKTVIDPGEFKVWVPTLTELVALLLLLSCYVVSDSFATPWTAACQAPLSMGFPGQEYWSGLPCSPPGDLPNPGIEPGSPVLQADYLPSEPLGKPWIRLSPVTHTLQGGCSSDIRLPCEVDISPTSDAGGEGREHLIGTLPPRDFLEKKKEIQGT